MHKKTFQNQHLKFFRKWVDNQCRPDKGKPSERVGRKATGLTLWFAEDMAAGLPGDAKAAHARAQGGRAATDAPPG
jgi:hypothetical protein